MPTLSYLFLTCSENEFTEVTIKSVTTGTNNKAIAITTINNVNMI